MKNISQSLKLIALALVLSVGISYVSAWTAPTATPPNSNAAAPINVGSTAQTKTGDICTTSGGTTKCLSSAGDNLGNHTATQALNMGGNNIVGSGSNSTYGAMTMQGSKNGWSGINFKDTGGSNSGTLMMHPNYSGFYNAADSNWREYVDDAGNSYQPGYTDTSDVYLRASGKWASTLGGAAGSVNVYQCLICANASPNNGWCAWMLTTGVGGPYGTGGGVNCSYVGKLVP